MKTGFACETPRRGTYLDGDESTQLFVRPDLIFPDLQRNGA
jgi:hypothetical protein